MDNIAVDALKERVKECEMKIAAILEAIDLECEYTPPAYTLVKPQKGDN